MRDALKDLQLYRHASFFQPVGVGDAFVAQWVLPSDLEHFFGVRMVFTNAKLTDIKIDTHVLVAGRRGPPSAKDYV